MENIPLVSLHEGASHNGSEKSDTQTCHLETGTLNPHTLVVPNIGCSLNYHLLPASYFVLSTVRNKGWVYPLCGGRD